MNSPYYPGKYISPFHQSRNQFLNYLTLHYEFAIRESRDEIRRSRVQFLAENLDGAHAREDMEIVRCTSRSVAASSHLIPASVRRCRVIPSIRSITYDVYGRFVRHGTERRRLGSSRRARTGRTLRRKRYFKADRVGGSRSVAGRTSRWKDGGSARADSSFNAAGHAMRLGDTERTIDQDTHGSSGSTCP